MRLSNGFVIDKEKTFGELKFTAVRDVFLQNEDGTPSTQLKKRIYDLKCSLHGGIIPVSVPPEVPLREFPYNAVVELVNPVADTVSRKTYTGADVDWYVKAEDIVLKNKGNQNAGVFKPTEGSVVHKGKIVPLLELGAGFDKEYTGRENIYLYGAVLGYSKEFIDSKFDEIVKFSGLKKFLDVPLKNYSSGMKSRLGFSIATIVEPEILILDEVLSVGDAKFRKKSEKKILSMMDKGVTVLFVSHSLEQVKRICTKAMILENGSIRSIGDIDTVSAEYEEMISGD